MKGYAPRVALKKGTRQLENGLLISPPWASHIVSYAAVFSGGSAT